MTWYAVQYKPSQGDRALENLLNQGASCFYPKILVDKVQGGKRTKKLEPLFNGYLFINIEQTDPLWAKIRSTRGVLRIVSFANKPAPICDAVIAYIREGLGSIKEQGGLQQGQVLELQDGPFRGLKAIFESYGGEERAMVLITFMQKQQRIQVPLSALRS